MSSFEQPPSSIQQGAEQAGQQPGASPSMGQVPGLPPTALSMQMQSLNDEYSRAQGGQQAMGAQMQPEGTGGPLTFDGFNKPQGADYARSSLQDMAERLAKGYGLQFGRGTLVDQYGQFQQTPDQLSAGGDMAGTAMSMNLVAQAVNERRIEQQQNKATAALQTGAGLLQSRGQGSIAAIQSGFYQRMADTYSNPNLLPEQQDFSFWIQEAQMERELANAAAGDGAGAGASSDIKTQRSIGNTNPYSPIIPPESTDSIPQGGKVQTTGPNAGKKKVSTYDPINKTTTVSWE